MTEIVVLADERMDAESAAAYVGKSKKTMAIWRGQGKGPVFVKRGTIWYYKADLDAWLAEGRARSTQQARLQREVPALAAVAAPAPEESAPKRKANRGTRRTARATAEA